jgi:hypothetical protein
MTWPSLDDLKGYLRVQTTAEDDVIQGLLDGAIGAVTGYINRAVEATEMVMEDPAATLNAYSSVRKLYTTDYPVTDDDPAPAITDQAGTTVDPTTYRLFPIIGMFRANPGICFDNGPYLITATVGLVFAPKFTQSVMPLLRRAVLDLAAGWYQQRNAQATQESEAGVSASWGPGEIPPRVCAMLANLKRPSQRIGLRLS